ncbi:putative tRNA-specific adenosine deaminase [Triangularia verruculosa]|uniref:tRNA-specific adenosine deaminase n=1 Tax=Triangularia verruculosa TaxID=2587418 RepID=A0AAN6XGE0_9PEZI|nr:putative tRNA-specific adenosine deaminase [Triangularia verruculosa]
MRGQAVAADSPVNSRQLREGPTHSKKTKMAVTLFQALSATGLKAIAFLQALLWFPAGAFRQALALLSATTSSPHHRPGSPTLPRTCRPADSLENNTLDDNNNNNNQVDLDAQQNSDSNTDLTMAGDTPSASRQQQQQQYSSRNASFPKVVPAIPRFAPTSKKDTGPAAAAAKITTVANDLAGSVANGVSRLSLSESASTSNRVLAGSDGNAGAASAAAVRATPAESNTNTGAAGLNKENFVQSNGALPDIFGGDDGLATQEVTRAPAVPLTHAISQTSKLKEMPPPTIQLGDELVHILDKDETPEQAAERAIHSGFMREALDMARLALRTNETPVGCVLVHNGRVIARGMNATNVSRNGTRHAELMAICALLSFSSEADTEPARTTKAVIPLGDKTNSQQLHIDEDEALWGDVDPRDGHLFPYGQKLHPAPRVDPSVIQESTLYVTVEPCVMCASLLRQLKIKKVYFGAVNDKFGGTGGVFRIHKNSPYSMASAPPSPAPRNGKGLARPVLERRPVSSVDVTITAASGGAPMAGQESQEVLSPDEEVKGGPDNSVLDPIDTSHLPGDGGNVERGYEAEGGWGRDEAVTLLRQFYVQENNRAPVPRKKEGRAARLAAMMERDGHAGGPMIDPNSTAPPPGDCNGAETPDVVGTPTVETCALAVGENKENEVGMNKENEIIMA